MSSPYDEALADKLIDRTIRERIVLVGVGLPGDEVVCAGSTLTVNGVLCDGAAGALEAVQVIDSPGASVAGVAGHSSSVAMSSSMVNSWYIVVLPLLVTR